jgi:hypothetical protein
MGTGKFLHVSVRTLELALAAWAAFALSADEEALSDGLWEQANSSIEATIKHGTLILCGITFSL